MSTKERTWTSTAPTKPGKYLFRCHEIEEMLLHVFKDGTNLLAHPDERSLGAMPVADVHNILTKPEWSLA